MSRARTQRKSNARVASQLGRLNRGQLDLKRLPASNRAALRVVENLRGAKALKKVVGLRETPAEKIIGPSFKGKRLLSSMVFETPQGETIRARLLRSADAARVWKMYYEGMGEHSRHLFASFPIFTGTDTVEKMSSRLKEMSVNRAPRGKVLKNINRGKAAGAFNPKYPVNREQVAKGAKPRLFNPSINYVMESPTGEVVGFFQLKYLGQTPIFGVAIRDAKHHQGLGRMGVRMAMDAARRLGFKTVRLTAEPSNPASKLYGEEGFKEIGRAKIHEGQPDERVEILMEARL